MDRNRVDWVDYAKGFCIVMVVMMHSTLGVEEAFGREGFMGYVVAFARPFRMPDFFMISGLFLARVIDRDWRDYLDRKVVHFAYFYVLWLTIQFAIRAPGMAAEDGALATADAYLLAFVEPFGTLWFIYLLPVFFVVTKLLRGVPVLLVVVVAAALQMAPIETGSTVIDEFANRYVYFYSGYAFAPQIFAIARWAGDNLGRAGLALVAWALLNGTLVFTGFSHVPGIELGLGYLGAMAVITVSVFLASRHWAAPLRFAGEHSIAVYLAFFLPMATTRTALLHLGATDHPGWTSVIVTTVAVITPLLLYLLVRGTSFRFLFERPAWARLETAPEPRREREAEAGTRG